MTRRHQNQLKINPANNSDTLMLRADPQKYLCRRAGRGGPSVRLPSAASVGTLRYTPPRTVPLAISSRSLLPRKGQFMRMISRRSTLSLVCLAALLGFVAAGAKDKPVPAKPGDFTSATIDFGIVCSDVERSVDFYTQAVGLTELAGFDVPADFGKDSGLTNNQPFHVHVLVAGEGDKATKLKLMDFKNATGKKSDQSFIHSTLGMRYTTIFVKDITVANMRMIAYGTMPLGKGLVEIPDGRFLGLYKDPDGNFIELVGAKAKK
jgi:catechol 2,3-dioxygenase-like lactoylglutathione lyase family enzyme